MHNLQVQSGFYSGKSGEEIGSGGSLRLPGRRGHILQVTKTGAHYVLFYTGEPPPPRFHCGGRLPGAEPRCHQRMSGCRLASWEEQLGLLCPLFLASASMLYGYSLKHLYTMAAGPEGPGGRGLKEDPRWQTAIDEATHSVPLLRYPPPRQPSPPLVPALRARRQEVEERRSAAQGTGCMSNAGLVEEAGKGEGRGQYLVGGSIARARQHSAGNSPA